MTQNIYDDPEFFRAYSGMERSVEGHAGAPEWPALIALLPDMAGLKVVDLGCGFGWFCRWARQAGAADVLGLDVSRNMLARAREMTSDAAIRYERADLEHLQLPRASCDLAYSSLALHYIENLPQLLETVHRALVPGGRLVFSMEHPIFTAPAMQHWAADAHGRPVWPLGRYLDEGPRITDWLAPGIVKRHRMLGTILNLLIGCGFTIAHVEEFGPTMDQVAARPEWARERERPMFLLVAAGR